MAGLYVFINSENIEENLEHDSCNGISLIMSDTDIINIICNNTALNSICALLEYINQFRIYQHISSKKNMNRLK